MGEIVDYKNKVCPLLSTATKRTMCLGQDCMFNIKYDFGCALADRRRFFKEMLK